MSNQPFSPRNQQQSAFPTLPRGTVVATYATYQEAVGAVDRLGSQDFPVEKVVVVGNDLHSIERVIGSMNYGRAALSGLLSGLWFGFFLGFLVLFWGAQNSWSYFAAAMAFGAGFGIISGVVTYAVSKRYRNFTSMSQIVATSYSVLVTETPLAAKAQQVLGATPEH